METGIRKPAYRTEEQPRMLLYRRLHELRSSGDGRRQLDSSAMAENGEKTSLVVFQRPSLR